jgi:hypothetical protein
MLRASPHSKVAGQADFKGELNVNRSYTMNVFVDMSSPDWNTLSSLHLTHVHEAMHVGDYSQLTTRQIMYHRKLYAAKLVFGTLAGASSGALGVYEETLGHGAISPTGIGLAVLGLSLGAFAGSRVGGTLGYRQNALEKRAAIAEM